MEFSPKRNKGDNWIMAGFREDEIQFKKGYIIDQMDKYWEQLKQDLENGRNTIARPTYLSTASNVLTLIGLTESAKRDTNETSSTNTHNSLGDDSTTPAEGDTDLTSEISGGTPTYARKAFTGDGQATVVNQTAKYGMIWDDGDLDVTPAVSVKESGVHWHVSDASKIHAHVTFTTFTFDAGDLFVIQINELMANA